jgi:hypothetical protein
LNCGEAKWEAKERGQQEWQKKCQTMGEAETKNAEKKGEINLAKKTMAFGDLAKLGRMDLPSRIASTKWANPNWGEEQRASAVE